MTVMDTRKEPMSPTTHFHRLGMVARWQPVHRGHVLVLRALCRRSDQALIGIGSANRQNLRSPFTLEETQAMIRLVLADREDYDLISVPDLDDGPRWRALVVDTFGELDAFVTANPYVRSLMEGDYRIVHPISLVWEEEKIPISGTMVRRAMARGEDWRGMVPKIVVEYLQENGLDERFRREFGLETLALESIIQERKD